MQFGLPYGIANSIGQVSRGEVQAILRAAADAHLDTLDTAIAYGESESCLGSVGVEGWRVVTKLPPVAPERSDIDGWVRASVQGSLERLGISRLRAVLLHRSHDLVESRGDELYAALAGLKRSGAVEKIGVSIYDPEELDALPPRFRMDLVQAPFNVLDRRLERSGWMARLKSEDVEIHVRSIFLQGLLLMEPAMRPARFAQWNAVLKRWDEWLRQERLSAIHACVRFVLSHSQINRVVVGVDSASQLRDIVAVAAVPGAIAPVTLVSDNPNLINPSCWQ